MRENITLFTKGLLAKAMLLVVFACVNASVKAEVIDLGELELGKEYELVAYKGYKATFTAPKSGTIITYTTGSYWPEPYMDEAYTKYVNQKHSYTNNGQTWEWTVEAGKTYYLYRDFLFEGGKFFMNYAASTLERQSVTPAENEVFAIVGAGQVNLSYNMGVSVSDVALVFNGRPLDTGVAYVSGSNVAIQLKGEIDGEIDLLKLLQSGALKPGDVFELVFTVTSISNTSLSITERVRYVAPELPAQLVEMKNMDKFLSYWFPGDDPGKLQMVFDHDLLATSEEGKGAYAMIQYGDLESDVEGDFYVEIVPGKVDGKTLTFDFTGVRRRSVDMLTSGNKYTSILVRIMEVRDANGDYVYTGGQGSTGSYAFEYDYVTVDADAVYEFTPASGSTIGISTTEIELWIQNYSSIRFGGVSYTYVDEVTSEEVVVKTPIQEMNPEIDENGDAIIMLPISEDLRGKNGVKIQLYDLLFADGVEREISAVYDVQSAVGIESVANGSYLNKEYFTIAGQSVDFPSKGVNIVRQVAKDGSFKVYKVLNK